MRTFQLLYFVIPSMMLSCGVSSEDGVGSKIVIENDKEALSGRVTYKNDKISVSALSLTTDYELTFVGESSPPTVGDKTLQATDVFSNGGYAYVTYNYAGEEYGGAVEIIDISDEENPFVISQILFSDADVNSLAVDDNAVYIAGAKDSDAPAFFSSIGLADGLFSRVDKTVVLESFAGNAVAFSQDNIFTSSGNDGGLSVISKDNFNVTSSVSISGLRDVDIDANGEIWGVGGTPGKLHKFASSDYSATTFDVGGASIAESKSQIIVGEQTLGLALGDGGIKILCKNDQKVLASIDKITVEGLEESLSVTNSLSLKNGLLFTANGEAGVSLYAVAVSGEKNGDCFKRTITYKGSLNFGEDLSANHVFYDNKYLFVADGLGGLKIAYLSQRDQEEDDNEDDFDPPVDQLTAICHKGKNTLMLPEAALAPHLAHGDSLGSCN